MCRRLPVGWLSFGLPIVWTGTKLYEKSSSLRNLSFGKKDRFNHDDIGWNYRMTNIQASLGISQLKRINQIVRIKHKIGLEYYKRLKNNSNLYIPELQKKYAKNIYWVVAILILNKKLKIDAKNMMKKLKAKGIATRPFFWPMNEQKIFKKLRRIAKYVLKYTIIPLNYSL